jgi:hypothetical protein
MRTHTSHAGEAPVSHPHTHRARGRYLEVPARADTIPAVTHEQIAQRAYELYLARGGGQGDPIGDWLAAERELQGGTRMFPPLTGHADSDLAH